MQEYDLLYAHHISSVDNTLFSDLGFVLDKMMPKWRKSQGDDQNLISFEVVMIHQHAKFQAIQSDCNKISGVW